MRIQSAIVLSTTLAAVGCEPFDQPAIGENEGSSTIACCGSLGSCVPEGLVTAEVGAHLAPDSCGETLLCAPTAWILDPTLVPRTCRAAQDREGRCLPACMPEVATRSAELQQGSCQSGELCAPCYDPVTGADTRACRIGPDPGPSEAPPAQN